MDSTFSVVRVSQNEILSNDMLFNTNNLWADQGRERPENYQQVLDRGNTRHWAPPETAVITLGVEDATWMLKAAQIGLHTGRHSHIYDDDLQKTVDKYNHLFPEVTDGRGWFVRTERVSLKYGQHGVGPYTSLRPVLESIVSSISGHECISVRDNLEAFRIYFFPWVDIKEEFRVFVYNNRVSAISLQHYSVINEWLASLSNHEVEESVGRVIVNFFERELKDRLKLIVGPNYTMDAALLRNGEVYFIEPNSFGADYAAGSALFHWVYEHDLLHGEPSDPVTIKFCDHE